MYIYIYSQNASTSLCPRTKIFQNINVDLIFYTFVACVYFTGDLTYTYKYTDIYNAYSYTSTKFNLHIVRVFVYLFVCPLFFRLALFYN